MTQPFSLLIKPVSADCNLRCDYCFYLKKCHLYPESSRHRMSDEVLEQLTKSYLATQQPNYSIGWQGGEPTLMGLKFYQKAVMFQKHYSRPGRIIGNGLQTNATLLDDKFATFFHDHNFLLGCSLDGPASIHNRFRLAPGRRGTHQDVLRGLEILKRRKVEFNILVLVNKANVTRASEVYRYLISKGYLFHQYIPCVEFDENGQLLPFAITGEEWGNFLCELFDEWYSQDTRRVSIRHFDSILSKIVDNNTTICTMGKNCCQYFVVEYNGDVYPCDFFVEKSLKLGNVLENSWEEMLDAPTYTTFGAKKSLWNKSCDDCKWQELCSGDCLKHRMYNTNSPQHLSSLCKGWKQFFHHSHSGFEKLADQIRMQRIQEVQTHHSTINKSNSIGRNELCPCGSGKKYKKCCIK